MKSFIYILFVLPSISTLTSALTREEEILRDVQLRATFRQCCEAHKMPKDCAFYMCTYENRRTSNATICKYTERCIDYTSEWLYCAMDGQNDVTDCLDEHAGEPYAVPRDCYPIYASGKAPSLNKIFKHGSLSNDCLKRTPLLKHCYKQGMKGSKHRNVCLKRGKNCKKFSHWLSTSNRQAYDLYLFSITVAYCNNGK